MLTPQSFEYDNGLYTEDQVCPGIYNEAEGEPESIYHLFGNHFESFYDCQLIPATEEDLKLIADIKKAEEELILQDMQNMVDFFEGLERAAAEKEGEAWVDIILMEYFAINMFAGVMMWLILRTETMNAMVTVVIVNIQQSLQKFSAHYKY